MSQKDIILKHLLEGKTITNLEAIDLYGITRISDIISKLRKEGWPISTKMEKTITRYGKEAEYGRYRMRMEQVSCNKG